MRRVLYRCAHYFHDKLVFVLLHSFRLWGRSFGETTPATIPMQTIGLSMFHSQGSETLKSGPETFSVPWNEKIRFKNLCNNFFCDNCRSLSKRSKVQRGFDERSPQLNLGELILDIKRQYFWSTYTTLRGAVLTFWTIPSRWVGLETNTVDT